MQLRAANPLAMSGEGALASAVPMRVAEGEMLLSAVGVHDAAPEGFTYVVLKN